MMESLTRWQWNVWDPPLWRRPAERIRLNKPEAPEVGTSHNRGSPFCIPNRIDSLQGTSYPSVVGNFRLSAFGFGITLGRRDLWFRIQGAVKNLCTTFMLYLNYTTLTFYSILIRYLCFVILLLCFTLMCHYKAQKKVLLLCKRSKFAEMRPCQAPLLLTFGMAKVYESNWRMPRNLESLWCAHAKVSQAARGSHCAAVWAPGVT